MEIEQMELMGLIVETDEMDLINKIYLIVIVLIS